MTDNLQVELITVQSGRIYVCLLPNIIGFTLVSSSTLMLKVVILDSSSIMLTTYTIHTVYGCIHTNLDFHLLITGGVFVLP